MNNVLKDLVREVVDVTGSAGPAVMEDDAPVLAETALVDRGPDDFYIVGLIGGKEVGKSALVNALVGRPITAATAWGPGTELAIAYVHESRAGRVKALLDAEVPGQYRIVTHDQNHLVRQVLLDLPDIDSHYEAHIELVRHMLRHLLFPIWIQSVEKYADRRPQELLARVAAGNDARNFIFCLNKVDQLAGRDAEGAAELREDFSRRLGRVLNLAQSPRVWLVSALNAGQFDLPELRRLLSRQKNPDEVSQSRKLASHQQGLSLLHWVRQQDLPARLAVVQRAQDDAEELLAQRIGSPVVERMVPAILDDPALRLGLADDVLKKRIARWPIVNILHVVLSPIVGIVRSRLAVEVQRGLEDPVHLVDRHLRNGSSGADDGRHVVADAVQGAFALLHQSHPVVGRLYAGRRLWEAMPTALAETELRDNLAATVQRQRGLINRNVVRRGGALAFLTRFILTIGALLWFPFLQPATETFIEHGIGRMALLAVRLFSVPHLLQSLGFLGIYFAILWLAVKWDTHRRVDAALEHWKHRDALEPTLSLAGQAMEWMGALTEPLRAARQRLESLVRRTEEISSAAAA